MKISLVLTGADRRELVVLTVIAYCPSLAGRISTLPSRLRLISTVAASSREQSTNHLHHIERYQQQLSPGSAFMQHAVY